MLDPFNPANNTSYIAVQSDGAIIVGGGGMNIGGVVRNGLARITTTGLLDPGWNPNLEWGVVNGIAIQADDKVIAGGTFTTVG
ncbi:hypothetical protein KBC03_07325 [Patescibacteria group bacterium]|nr:hypothetical protein [Patescibacteria group bacterium]